MKSNKQRHAEIKENRLRRARKKIDVPRFRNLTFSTGDCALVDFNALTANNSYGTSQFVKRGFYLPLPFICRDCGVEEIWAAKQQKLWYEKWQGPQHSMAVRCRACRKIKRERQAYSEAMRIAGLVNKQKINNHEHAN